MEKRHEDGKDKIHVSETEGGREILASEGFGICDLDGVKTYNSLFSNSVTTSVLSSRFSCDRSSLTFGKLEKQLIGTW